MENETYFRKVSVKERLPEINKVVGFVPKGGYIISGRYLGERFHKGEDSWTLKELEYWLEEIPLPSSKAEAEEATFNKVRAKSGDSFTQKRSTKVALPTDEEIEKEFVTHGHYDDLANERQLGKQEGAMWMRDKILSTPTSNSGEGEKKIDEQKILDALRFTWRNLNRLKGETEKQISSRTRNSMNFRIRKVIKYVDDALNEFALKPDECICKTASQAENCERQCGTMGQ